MKIKCKKLFLIIISIALLSLLSSCSSGLSSTKPLDTGSIHIPPVNSPAPVLPFSSYVLTANTEATVFYAGTLLDQNCMAKKGVPFAINSLLALEQDPFYAQHLGISAHIFGVYNLKEAEVHGYEIYVSPATPLANRNMKYVMDLNNNYAKKYGQAYYIMQNSCLKYVSATNFITAKQGKELNATDTFIGNQINNSVSETQDNPIMLSDIKKWSSCMASHGYDIKTPPPAIKNDKHPPKKAQIAEAITDYNCKVKVNMMNTWLAVESYYQKQIINKHPTEFQEMAQIDSYLITAAKRVMTKY